MHRSRFNNQDPNYNLAPTVIGEIKEADPPHLRYDLSLYGPELESRIQGIIDGAVFDRPSDLELRGLLEETKQSYTEHFDSKSRSALGYLGNRVEWNMLGNDDTSFTFEGRRINRLGVGYGFDVLSDALVLELPNLPEEDMIQIKEMLKDEYIKGTDNVAGNIHADNERFRQLLEEFGSPELIWKFIQAGSQLKLQELLNKIGDMGQPPAQTSFLGKVALKIKEGDSSSNRDHFEAQIRALLARYTQPTPKGLSERYVQMAAMHYAKSCFGEQPSPGNVNLVYYEGIDQEDYFIRHKQGPKTVPSDPLQTAKAAVSYLKNRLIYDDNSEISRLIDAHYANEPEFVREQREARKKRNTDDGNGFQAGGTHRAREYAENPSRTSNYLGNRGRDISKNPLLDEVSILMAAAFKRPSAEQMVDIGISQNAFELFISNLTEQNVTLRKVIVDMMGKNHPDTNKDLNAVRIFKVLSQLKVKLDETQKSQNITDRAA